ncbi:MULTISPECIES: hypothetical protein [unclassified Campylobacter]|uniref:hypothetical protein n=1 Tax=unclassified Campylobacter TaxID=2593542 RepID=UPI0022E9B87E|nr:MULTISPECIES: hypothetical protein [unclassified Campylobacter]MDA3054524.1 hypothetical protein [Campylobacter sp. VBCF_07 NA4]MDA3060692.1 hypothetical protein [Campylobacter sp. VBCF_02 NA5]MDA3070042.1 hypothetical protein [Campylobacter sp. VBCF_08 NA3]WBR54479.1 hypothetical protein PF027_01025 [Campylobacter sp. VBCF_01 NA2]
MKSNLAKIFLATSLACACSFADEGAFIGIGGGYNFAGDVDVSGVGSLDSVKQGVISVKGGYDFGDFRAYSQYNYNTKYSEEVYMEDTLLAKGELSGHELLVGADYTPALSSNLKLAVGPYMGLSLLKVSLSDGEFSDSQTQKGFIIGGHVGLIIDSEIGQFEAGIKADKSWHNGTSDWPDFDKSTFGGYAGYNYKFN